MSRLYVGKKVLVPREEMIEEAMTDLWLSLHLSYLSFCAGNSRNSSVFFHVTYSNTNQIAEKKYLGRSLCKLSSWGSEFKNVLLSRYLMTYLTFLLENKFFQK